MNTTTIITSIIAALLGGGLIGFIEFMIRRRDEKNDKNKEVLEAVEKLDSKIDERFEYLSSRSNERFDELTKKIDKVDKKGDERNAVAARVRILRFADEMMEDRRHSKDSWDQCLSDITDYEKYCDETPQFKNNQTAATVNFIKKNYSERLEKHDFL